MINAQSHSTVILLNYIWRDDVFFNALKCNNLKIVIYFWLAKISYLTLYLSWIINYNGKNMVELTFMTPEPI